MADDVVVRARLQDDLSRPLAAVRQKIKDVGDQTSRAGAQAAAGTGGFLRLKSVLTQGTTGMGRFSTMVSGLGSVVRGATVGGVAALGAGLAAAGTIGISTASQMEQARISFETMLGGADKAGKFLGQLQQFAAKTPFEFPELQTAASSLISVGVDANKVIPIMTTLGDVTSGMGTGSEGVQRATVALQQMSAAGRITGEDLNQLRDAGIPVFDLLSAATGKTKEQISAMAQSGKLGKKEMEAMFKALETGKGLERFSGLMEKQSQSLEGLWSTMKDTVGQGLANLITPALPLLKSGLEQLNGVFSSGMTGVQEFFKAFSAGDGAVDADGFVGLMQTIGGAASGLFEFLKSGDINDAFANIINPDDSDEVINTFLGIRNALVQLKDFITGTVAPAIGGALASIGSSMGTGLVDTIKFIADHSDAAAAMAVGLGALAVAWGIWNGVVAIGTGVMAAYNAVMALNPIFAIAMAVIALTAALVYFFTQTETGKALWASFTGFLSSAWENTCNAIKGAWEAVSSWFSGAVSAVSGFFSDAVSAITGFFSALPGQVGAFASQAVEAVVGFFTSLPGRLRAIIVTGLALVIAGFVMLVGFITSLPGRVAAGMAAFGQVVLGAVNAVVGFFAALPGRVMVGLTMFASAVMTGVNMAVSFFASLPGRALSALAMLVSFVTAQASAAATALWSKIQSGVNQAVAFVSGLPGQVASGLASLASTMAGLASSAVEGFVKFFTDLPGRVMGAIGDLGSKISGGLSGIASDALSQATGFLGGDTTTSRATSSSSWVGALPHMSAGQSISNIGVGGGGRGPGSGDHQAGRAVDVVGTGLSRLVRSVSAAGGYGAIHGTGSTRHAHLVPATPMGDTATSRARYVSAGSSTPAAAPVVVSGVNVTVNHNGPAGPDFDRAVRAAVSRGIRDAVERG